MSPGALYSADTQARSSWGKNEGKLITDVLLNGQEGENTVVKAWGNMWKFSSNKTGKIARAVFWPECESDTIYGVPEEHVTDPDGPYDLDRLSKRDFTQT